MFALPLFTLLVFCCRKLDAQVRAAVEMYSEDWVIVHRRWVLPGAARGRGARVEGLHCLWLVPLFIHPLFLPGAVGLH